MGSREDRSHALCIRPLFLGSAFLIEAFPDWLEMVATLMLHGMGRAGAERVSSLILELRCAAHAAVLEHTL